MKTSTKLLMAAMLVAGSFFTINLKAQSLTPGTWRLNLGVEAGSPTNYNISNFDFGGTAQLQYNIGKSTALTLTSGYYDLLTKSGSAYYTFDIYNGYSTSPIKGSTNIIPVKAGVKAYISTGWYLDGEAGAGFVSGLFTYKTLILSPGLGYTLKNWDVNLRYENISNSGSHYGLVNLKVAYGFGL